jgi:zinc D-Ala-D-Ala carboxypeptidase
MKGWAAAVALVAVVGAAGVGLWATWDSTQTAATDPTGGPPLSLVTTTTSALRSTPPTTAPLPACTVGDEAVAADPDRDWASVVIDTGHSLPESYVPTDLVSVSQAGFNGQDQVRQVVIDDLAALGAAAEANGTPLVIISAYRSYSYQQDLFDRRARAVGEEEAAKDTARPGHSEHQLGTTIDVVDPGTADLTTAFAATAQGQWVAAHAYEYGFVLSYPDGARDRTCYEYEPWHQRYVGRDVARRIHDAGVTAREWFLRDRADTPG